MRSDPALRSCCGYKTNVKSSRGFGRDFKRFPKAKQEAYQKYEDSSCKKLIVKYHLVSALLFPHMLVAEREGPLSENLSFLHVQIRTQGVRCHFCVYTVIVVLLVTPSVFISFKILTELAVFFGYLYLASITRDPLYPSQFYSTLGNAFSSSSLNLKFAPHFLCKSLYR